MDLSRRFEFMALTSVAESARGADLPWKELDGIVGAGNVLRAQEDLIPYSFDGTAALSQMPACVLFVSTTEQVSQVLKLANAHNLAAGSPSSAAWVVKIVNPRPRRSAFNNFI